MKLQDLQLFEIANQLQNFHDAIKFGQWYYESEAYFEHYLKLKQGKLFVDDWMTMPTSLIGCIVNVNWARRHLISIAFSKVCDQAY